MTANVGDRCRIRRVGGYGGLNPITLREDGWTPQSVLTVKTITPLGHIVASWGDGENQRRAFKASEIEAVGDD